MAFIMSLLMLSNLLVAQTITPAYTQSSLGEAKRFSIIAATSVTSADTIYFKGDIGSLGTVASKIFTEGCVFKDGNCVISKALVELYRTQQQLKSLISLPLPATLSDTALTAGVYRIDSTLLISGTITLWGDSNSVFVFNVRDSLTFAQASKIVLNGVNPQNIYWNVESNVSILDYAEITGNVLATGKISISTNAVAKNASLYSQESVSLKEPGDFSKISKGYSVRDINYGFGSKFALGSLSNLIADDPVSVVGSAGADSSISSNITATGTIYPVGDCMWQNAVSDISNAIYIINNLEATKIPEQLGGQTLAPGVYEVDSLAQLTGTLTLSGDSTSVYVFRLCKGLIVSDSAIVDLGNVLPHNIYWHCKTGSFLELGENINFSGLVTVNGSSLSKNNNGGKVALFATGNITLQNSESLNPVYIYSREEMSKPYCTGFTAYAGSDATITNGQSVQLGTTPVADYYYVWKPTSGLDNYKISNPLASPDTTTAYVLSQSNNIGCFAYDSVTVTYIPLQLTHCDSVIEADLDSTHLYQINDTIITLKAQIGSAVKPQQTRVFFNGFRLYLELPEDTPVATIKRIAMYEGSCSNAHLLNEKYYTDNDSLYINYAGPTIITGSVYIQIEQEIDTTCPSCPKYFNAYFVPIPLQKLWKYPAMPPNIQCSNLIKNPGFDSISVSGPIEFTSDYTYISSGQISPGKISVTNDAGLFNPQHWSEAGSNYFLICDGDTGIGQEKTVWQQTIHILPNSQYYWMYNVKNLDTETGNPYPELNFIINDSVQSINSIYNGGWLPAGGTWNSLSDTVAEIKIITTAHDYFGNDFAIDNIRFIPVITILADAYPDTSICEGESVQLNASGGTIYEWINNTAGLSDTNIPAPVASPQQTTTYTVKVTNEIGCWNTASVTVTISPQVELGDNIVINTGETVTLNKIISLELPYHYLWNTGDTTGSITVSPTQTTTYYLTVTDTINGCSDWDSVKVIVSPPVLTTRLIDSDCGATGIAFDQVLTADSVPGATQYEFLVENDAVGFSESIVKTSNSFSLNELSGAIEYNTVYDISVRIIIGSDIGAYGNVCQVTTEPPLPVADAGTDITVESGQSAVIGSNPVSGITYKWTPSIGLSNTNISNPAIALTNRETQPVTLIYIVRATDISTGFTAKDTVLITINPSPVLVDSVGYSLNAMIDTAIGTSEMYVYDRFGDSIKLKDIKVKDVSKGLTETCNAGFFRLVFQDVSDNTNEGFDDTTSGTWLATVGEEKRDCACQMFKDLSELIEPANDPYTGYQTICLIRIIIRKWPTVNPPPPNVLGASSTYKLIPNLSNSGIIDGEAWKTINGGFDSFFNLANVGYPPQQYYHGYIMINPNQPFHTNYEVGNNNPAYDLYSVLLHESIHTLGFYSNISSNGSSNIAGTLCYSRYDTYLETIAGEPLIINNDSCYNTDFNADTNDLIIPCNIIFQGTDPQPVYSPSSFSDGSSLSHFDTTCSPFNSYIMTYSTGQGSNYVKRRPTHIEVKALCDLEYQLRDNTNGLATYGIDPTNLFIYDSTYNLCGSRIAGVNDFFKFNTDTPFIVNAGDSINFTSGEPTDILANDENAVSFDCLETVIGLGSVDTSSGTSFTYKASNLCVGTEVLRYIPVSSTGKRGNITYVFIKVVYPAVIFTDCDIGTCGPNLVINGDFENAPTNPYSLGENPFSELFYTDIGFSVGSQYTITDTTGLDPFISSMGYNTNDHTTGNGYYFYGDAPVCQCCDIIAWQQDSIFVEAGITYKFSAWFKQHPYIYPPYLKIEINNEPVLGPFAIDTLDWTQVCVLWTAPDSGFISIGILINGAFGIEGQDFGIDDIEFKKAGSPVSFVIYSIDESCPGANDGEATVTELEGTAPFIYLWSGGQTDSTAIELTAGIYSVTVTDANLCTAAASVTITEPTSIQIFSTNDSICYGDTIQLFTSLTDTTACVFEDYLIETIPYSPILYSGTTVTLGDDDYISANIGFNFNFYCNNYEQFYISSNGFITFNSTTVNGYNVQFLPNTNEPNNLIAFAWEDLDPSANGTIEYFTTGTAPYRKLVVNFIDIPFYEDSLHPPLTTQVILYETSNIIEIHTTSTDALNLMTMGIENIDGTIAHSVPGRNRTNWSASYEGIRITPLIYSNIVSYSWFPGISLSDSTIANPLAFPDDNTEYILTATNIISGCVSHDSLLITVFIPDADLGPDTSICYGDSIIIGPQIIDSSATYQWIPSTGLNNANIANPLASPDITTEYILTVTDIHGCIAYDTIIIYSSPLLTATITTFNNVTCNGLCDGSATLTPSGGTPPYDYLWSDGQSDTIANNLCAGDYTVTVTDYNSCTAITSVTINTNIELPISDFTLDEQCLFINVDLTFTNLSTYATEYIWDFDDGTTSADINPVHQFTEYGYYCVSLTASNLCGSETYSETIFVLPDECACDYLVNYNVPDGTIINSYTTWDYSYWGSYEITVQGDIIVNPYAHLIIGNNMTVRFGPKGRIRVSPRGRLTISQSTLTNLDFPCNNYMWQGIEIGGNIMFPSHITKQGVIYLDDNVTIENAHIGILLGVRNTNFICNPSLWPGPFIFVSRGGIIQTSGSSIDFINNGIDIKFLRKIYPYDASGNIIENCNFICDPELLDANYNTIGSNPYPNYQNPWAGYANAYQRTDVGIYIDGQKGFNIQECTFENKRYCIESFDSKYNVYNCDFQQAKFGIKIENTNQTVDNRHEISGCTFDLMPGETGIKGGAIKIKGGRFDYIHDNKFGYLVTDQTLNYIGIHTINASSFNISNNEFNRFIYGVRVGNSGGSGGRVSAWNTNISSWTGNIFTQCNKNIFTSSDNSRLRLKCNICNNTDSTLYTVNFETYDTLANQGSMPPTFPITLFVHRYAAGNEFHPPDDNSLKTIISHNSSYNYYRHDNPSEVIPDVSTSQVTINVTPIGYDKISNTIDCPPLVIVEPILLPVILSKPPFTKLDSLKDEINLLKDDYYDLELSLDNGNTQQLLEAIYGNTPTGKLKNMLINNKPLSDTVIISLITEYPLSNGNFKIVMYMNLPVSKKVEPYFYEKLEALPPGIANQLKKLQGSNPNYTTLASIQREIAHVTQQRQLFLNELIILLTDTLHNRKEDAIALLENEGTIEAEQTLIATYIADSNFTAAAAKLAAMPLDVPEVADWVELNYILLNLYMEGKTLYQLDSLQEQFIRDLAYKCPAGLGTSNAQSILDLLYREEVTECPLFITTKSMKFNEEKTYIPEREVYLGDNYPEPFTGKTYIPYYLPEGITGKIVVRDIYGRNIAVYEIVEGKNILEINTQNWANGVYMYGLLIDGEIHEYKKMVLTWE